MSDSPQETQQLPEYETLLLSVADQVAVVELNRPDKANSMNAKMWDELRLCFQFLDDYAPVRAIVLAASGKYFCSGLDLSMFEGLVASKLEKARAAESFRRTILKMQNDLSAIEQCRKPVLAAIHGLCIGGGVDMVCCTDMRYCTEKAYFSIKEIDIGMTADVGTLQRLPKLIADGVVRELAYTGRKMFAEEAQQVGFVNKVFTDEQSLRAGVMEIARQIASKSPLAMRGTKESILYSRDHSVADSLNQIATWNAGILSVDDVMKAVAAQMEGKTAEFDD